MSTEEKKVVKFRKGWRGYNTGESAGFPADQADILIKNEIADDVTAKGKKTATTAKDPNSPTKGAGGKGAGAQPGAGEGGGAGEGSGNAPGTGADGAGAGAVVTNNDDRP